MESVCLDDSASHERPAVTCAQACQKVVRPPRGVRLGRVLCAAATVVSHTLRVRKLQRRKKLSPAAAPASLPPCLQLTGAIRKLHVKLPLTMKVPWTTRPGHSSADHGGAALRRVQITELMTRRFKTPCDDEPVDPTTHTPVNPTTHIPVDMMTHSPVNPMT